MDEKPRPKSQLAPVTIAAGFLCAALAACGCGRESKVEQIRRGVENVDRHAKEIERESQSPATGGKPATPP